MAKTNVEHARTCAIELFEKANIIINKQEKKEIEIADFGLDDFEKIGLSLVIYVNTDRVCAKELALLPNQICPEHLHPAIPEKNYPGKEETFRCRYGTVYLYVSGDSVENPKATVDRKYKDNFTVWHEIVLHPGEQYTLKPNTLHWFQAGEEGTVVSEFSTSSYDECDIFTDKNIIR